MILIEIVLYLQNSLPLVNRCLLLIAIVLQLFSFDILLVRVEKVYFSSEYIFVNFITYPIIAWTAFPTCFFKQTHQFPLPWCLKCQMGCLAARIFSDLMLGSSFRFGSPQVAFRWDSSSCFVDFNLLFFAFENKVFQIYKGLWESSF